MTAPIDVPAMRIGFRPSSSSASMIGIWAKPRAPPPPRARPMRGVALPPSAMTSRRRLADADDDQLVGVEQALCHPPDVVDSHLVEEGDAALGIVNAEIVHLQAEQLVGD